MEYLQKNRFPDPQSAHRYLISYCGDVYIHKECILTSAHKLRTEYTPEQELQSDSIQ